MAERCPSLKALDLLGLSTARLESLDNFQFSQWALLPLFRGLRFHIKLPNTNKGAPFLPRSAQIRGPHAGRDPQPKPSTAFPL